jgi:hypothetical protein
MKKQQKLSLVRYVWSESDMSYLYKFKPKIVVTFVSGRNFQSNEVDMFHDILEEILPKEYTCIRRTQ